MTLSTDAEPVYFWGGYVNTPGGNVTFLYSIGTLAKVSYEWLRFKDEFITSVQKPRIQVITGCRELTLLEEEKFASFVREYEDI